MVSKEFLLCCKTDLKDLKFGSENQQLYIFSSDWHEIAKGLILASKYFFLYQFRSIDLQRFGDLASKYLFHYQFRSIDLQRFGDLSPKYFFLYQFWSIDLQRFGDLASKYFFISFDRLICKDLEIWAESYQGVRCSGLDTEMCPGLDFSFISVTRNVTRN